MIFMLGLFAFAAHHVWGKISDGKNSAFFYHEAHEGHEENSSGSSCPSW